MSNSTGVTGVEVSASKAQTPPQSASIHSYWLLPALGSFLIWTAFVVILWLTTISGSTDIDFALELLGTFGLLLSGGTAYLVYALVDRCNKHYSQTQQLFWTSLEKIEAASNNNNVIIPLRSAQETTAKLTRAENQRSGLLWALLSMIPLAGWIFAAAILWLVSRSLAKHSWLEGPAIEDLDRTLKASGNQGISGGTTMIRSRTIFGYLILAGVLFELAAAPFIGLAGYFVITFLTIGGFTVLWLDLSIWDPLAHFRNHLRIEGDVVASLRDIHPLGGS